jgi:hypothetical protein
MNELCLHQNSSMSTRSLAGQLTAFLETKYCGSETVMVCAMVLVTRDDCRHCKCMISWRNLFVLEQPGSFPFPSTKKEGQILAFLGKSLYVSIVLCQEAREAPSQVQIKREEGACEEEVTEQVSRLSTCGSCGKPVGIGLKWTLLLK